MSETKKQYIGDSVYADFDGYHVIVTTENGYGPSNTIYMEYGVFMQLMKYGSQQFGLDSKKPRGKDVGATT